MSPHLALCKLRWKVQVWNPLKILRNDIRIWILERRKRRLLSRIQRLMKEAA